MLKSIWMWILNKIFKVPTETKQKEVEDNLKYATDYENINSINFNAIFSNKLANYVINDSNLNITKENARVDLLNQIGQSMWKKGKKITSMAFGYGGVFLVPYVKGNKLFYNIVPQGRVTIDSTEGDLITGVTILAERKEITKGIGQTKTYIRWTNYRLQNGNCIIEQRFSDETGKEIPVPDFWKNIMLKQTITNVDRALLGYIKSPVNNRKTNDKYGVSITYGCDATINEIKETMKQMLDEFRLKRPFVGIDATLFKMDNTLPTDGLYKAFDFGTDGEKNFEVFDPAFRSYTERLQELFKRLEHEIGTSYGIISEVNTQNATATEIKRAMYDTYTIVDDMRSNIEKGLNDFFYACNVLANAYNLTPQGEYEIGFDWSYSLIEDSQESFNQIRLAVSDGAMDLVEERQWLKPDETIEESQAKIDEIRAKNPSIQDLLGTRGEE
jgi:A118 family predicted phage portal protein